MNLEFKNVSELTNEGTRYVMQKADVTHNRSFWFAWKEAQKREDTAVRLGADKETFAEKYNTIKRYVTLRREIVNGNVHTFAYRLRNTNRANSFARFDCNYHLKDQTGLLPYQPPSVQHICDALVNRGCACDGSDTGLGKTFVALKSCKELKMIPAVICKKTAISDWKRACHTMDLTPQFIINWEQAKNGKFSYCKRRHHPYSKRYIYKWDLPKHVLLIFDEVHVACNDNSQNYAMYTASCGLPSLSLSATFADRPARLKALFHVLKYIPESKFDDWLIDFSHFTNGFEENESLSEVEDMKVINKILYPHFGYRLAYEDKNVKKYFPKGIYQTLIIDTGKQNQQNALYEKMVDRVKELKSRNENMKAVTEDLRYRQAAEMIKADAIIDLTNDYLFQGKSVCIFVNFRDTLTYLAKKLKTKSLIYGTQERQHIDRREVLDNFQAGKSRIIISTVDAGGQSINLQDTKGNHPRISLICPTYNPVMLKQVLGRTLRAGSKSTPVMKLVYAAGTIEEKVARNVARKLQSISALNDGDLMEPDLFNLGFKRGE